MVNYLLVLYSLFFFIYGTDSQNLYPSIPHGAPEGWSAKRMKVWLLPLRVLEVDSVCVCACARVCIGAHVCALLNALPEGPAELDVVKLVCNPCAVAG